MVHVSFMGVHLMLDSSIMSSTSFIKSLYQVLSSMRYDVEAHEEQEYGHGKPSEDFSSFQTAVP